MMKAIKSLGPVVALAGLLFGTAERAQAGVSLVTSRGALGGNDTIDWGQLGPSGTQISNPVTVTTTGGNTDVAAQVSGNGIRLDQGNGWAGNFAPGDHLYYTQYAFGTNNQGPITLTFNQGVSGVGTQVQENFYGPYTAFVTAYDASHNVLGTFTENGTASGAGDNSAIFLGITSTSSDIASVTFGLTNGGNGTTADFAINQVSILSGQVEAVPEPSSLYWALSGSVLGIGYAWRKHRRKPTA